MTDSNPSSEGIVSQASRIPPHWRRWWLSLAVAVLLAVHAALAGTSMRRDAMTFDEIAHMTAGASYWLFHDYRLNPENGNLPQRLAGLPLVLSGYRFPDVEGAADWNASDVWNLGHRYFFASGNDADQMVFHARLPFLALSLILGSVVFGWSRRLWGDWGGLLSLCLYVFCPTILAHGRLATSDLTGAATLLATIGVSWAAFSRLTWLTLIGSLATIGLAAVAKTSAVLLGPMLLLLLGIRVMLPTPIEIALSPLMKPRVVSRRLSRLVIGLGFVSAQACAAVAAVWLFHGFRFTAFHHAVADSHGFYRTWNSFGEFGLARHLLVFARDHQLLPEAFVYGTAHALAFSRVRAAFLNGEYSITGWWWFFPFTMLVKTPVTTLLLAVGAAAAAWKLPERRRLLTQATPLLVFVAVYGAAALATGLNIGHRHLLPVYPAIFILVGALGHAMILRLSAARILVLALVTVGAAECLLIWPHYISYFNPLLGGPEQGYRRLVDSSLDWGQDLTTLKRYLDEHALTDQELIPVYLSYFGTASPKYYGIDGRRLPSYSPFDGVPMDLEPLQPGVYCISATMLQNLYVPTFGQWCEPWELRYQHRRRQYLRYLSDRATPEGREKIRSEIDPDGLTSLLIDFRHLEFGRLTRHLLLREPDARAGYSIHIYNVTEEDLHAALVGPPAELQATPGVKGQDRP